MKRKPPVRKSAIVEHPLWDKVVIDENTTAWIANDKFYKIMNKLYKKKGKQK